MRNREQVFGYDNVHLFPIHGLSIMSSCGCNLKCEYCVIHKSAANHPKEVVNIQQKTIEALKDGSFCTNAVNSVIAMGSSPNEIFQIDLWGQEQTLTLEHFYGRISEWLDAFPNWNKTFFSTNGQAYPEKIVALIQALDNALDREFKISIQWSYDGSYSGESLRHDEDNKVIKNLTYVIEELNKIKLNHLFVDMHLHGVVSFDLIRHLDGDINKIKEYWDECNKVAGMLPTLSLNKRVHIAPYFSTADEAPYPASTQDGFDFYDFYMKSAIVGADGLGLTFFSGQWIHCLHRAFPETQNMSLTQAITWLYENMHRDDMREIINNQLSTGFFCGNGVGELKLMYDGSLVSCQNSIFERDVEKIEPEDNLVAYGIKKTWAQKHYYFNPATATPEEIMKYKYIYSTGRTQTFWHTFNTTITKLYYLSQAGQINPIYENDFEALIKHAFISTFLNQCAYNNAIWTGSMWTKDTGILRKYCNGVAAVSERHEILQSQKLNPNGGGF
jgi:hypothetical protein